MLIYFRYSYDPCTQSLNEFPEAELSVTAGDYVLVWGEADEDGFFEGINAGNTITYLLLYLV